MLNTIALGQFIKPLKYLTKTLIIFFLIFSLIDH